MKIADNFFEDTRTFGGLVVSSQDGDNIMLQTTDYGVVCGRPVAFNRDVTEKLRNFLNKLLEEKDELPSHG